MYYESDTVYSMYFDVIYFVIIIYNTFLFSRLIILDQVGNISNVRHYVFHICSVFKGRV